MFVTQTESAAPTVFPFNKRPARAVRNGQPSSDFCRTLGTSYSVSGEGTQYAYYKAGNSKVKNRSGSVDPWWERSPYSDSSNYFCYVDREGNANGNFGYASSSIGVAFGFCV